MCIKSSHKCFLAHLFNVLFFLFISPLFCLASDICRIASPFFLSLTALNASLSQNLSFFCDFDLVINASAIINAWQLYWMPCCKTNHVHFLSPEYGGTVRAWPNCIFADFGHVWDQFGPIHSFNLLHNFSSLDTNHLMSNCLFFILMGRGYCLFSQFLKDMVY